MTLSYKAFGEDKTGTPIIILHGMLGSSRNWTQVAKVLSEAHPVYALDLPDHGDSPSIGTLTYPKLAEAVENWMTQQGIEKGIFIGHSMGGKTAMWLAVKSSQKVAKLVVVDICPKAYPWRHGKEFEAMRGLNLNAITSRKDADQAMEANIPSWGLRQFLLTNLERTPENTWRWKIDIDALESSKDTICAQLFDNNENFAGETLFIVGERSDYVLDSDKEIIHKHFPGAKIHTIKEAGHNPHADDLGNFYQVVEAFIGS